MKGIFSTAVKRSKKAKSPIEERSHASKTKSNGEERPFASLFAKANLTSSNTKKQGQTKEEIKRDSKNKTSRIEPVSTSKKGDVKLDVHITKKDDLKKSIVKPEQNQNGMTFMYLNVGALFVNKPWKQKKSFIKINLV